MSEQAIEFVENWVSEKIEELDHLPEDNDSQGKAWAAQCLAAARAEGIPDTEINETFDDLAAFMAGQIQEAKDREEDEEDEDDDEDDEDDEDEDDDKDKKDDADDAPPRA
jgi:hypothetical protein